MRPVKRAESASQDREGEECKDIMTAQRTAEGHKQLCSQLSAPRRSRVACVYKLRACCVHV